MNTKRYRVAQWATGNVGSRALRAVIEHPQLDLVGVYVYSEAKAGRDAGELAGVSPTGVIATNDIDEILAAKPDCVLYMPSWVNLDDVCRLLESGVNIASTRMEFHRPESMDPEERGRVEEACKRGETSLYSTGSSPGFVTEALPMVLLSLQRRLDRLVIDEFADMSSRDSPEMIFQLMGFGTPAEQYDPIRAEYAGYSFAPSLQVVADAVGLPIDSVETAGEVAVARHRVEVAAGVLEPGTVGAMRTSVNCNHEGKPVLTFRANWYLTTDLEPQWDLRESGWRVMVEGDAPLDISIRFPVSKEEYPKVTPGLTAHRPVNAIPNVVEAEPGIRTTADLPQIIPQLGG